MDIPVYPSEDAPTKLLNLQHVDDDEVDVYIGGETDLYEFDSSVHKNPYPIAEYGRRGSLAHYKAYFYDWYLTDEDYQSQVHDLWGKTLAEWNYPEHCHGEVIIDLLETRNDHGRTAVLEHIRDELESLDSKHLGYEGLKNRSEALDLVEEKLSRKE